MTGRSGETWFADAMAMGGELEKAKHHSELTAAARPAGSGSGQSDGVLT